MITEQVRALEGDKPIEPPIEDRLRALFRQRAEDFLLQAGEELRAPAGAGRGKAAALGQAAADCIRAETLLRRRGELSDTLRLDDAVHQHLDAARAADEEHDAAVAALARYLFRVAAGVDGEGELPCRTPTDHALAVLSGAVDRRDFAYESTALDRCRTFARRILTRSTPDAGGSKP